MSVGAELRFLEVLPLGFLCPNECLAGNAAIGELKASYCQNRFHVEDLER
jgi:hypothetical protein